MGLLGIFPLAFTYSHLAGYCLSAPKPFTLYLIITSSVSLPRHLPREGSCVSFATATHSSSSSDRPSQKVAGDTESRGRLILPDLVVLKSLPVHSCVHESFNVPVGSHFPFPPLHGWIMAFPIILLESLSALVQRPPYRPPDSLPQAKWLLKNRLGWGGGMVWNIGLDNLQALSVDKINTLSCTPSSLHLVSPLPVSSDAPLTIHKMTNRTWLRRNKRLSSAPSAWPQRKPPSDLPPVLACPWALAFVT